MVEWIKTNILNQMITNRVPNIFLSLLLFTLQFQFIHAQQALNVDFEIKSVEGTNRPWGWFTSGWGNTTFEMDSLTKQSGSYSLKAFCADSQQNCTEQSLRFDIESFELKGKNVTLDGFIKMNSIEGQVHYSFGYTFLDSEMNYQEKDTTSTLLSGTSDWGKYSINLTIPKHAQNAFFSIHYAGSGTAWFDNFKLKIGKSELNEVKTADGFTKKQLKQLVGNSSIISTVNPSDSKSGFDDLESFKAVVGNSTIIGLGEATHGTSEFFTLKNRLLHYAVSELGFRVFALEDNHLAVEKINTYVLTGVGNAKEAMSNLFDVWYRDEMISLIEWVRTYNTSHIASPVSFVGFDIQDPAGPLDSLIAFLEKQDKALYSTYSSKLSDFKSQNTRIYTLSNSVKLSRFTESKELLASMQSNKSNWLSKAHNHADSTEILVGIHYGTLVKQYAEHLFKGHWSLCRDEAMAENVNWLKNERFPDSKIVLWAHDVHISRCDYPDEFYNLNASISMGSFLSKMHGGNYKAFSLSTYQGSYTAMKSYTNYEKIQCPLYKGPIGSLDHALHQVSIIKNASFLFLPLSRKDDWLVSPMPVRFANHVSTDYSYWQKISIPYQFDAVFFIDETHGSIPIK